MEPKEIAPREAFGKALVKLGRLNERVVVLDADVSTSTKTSEFRNVFPERFFQIGLREQNMIGIAAGMATVGLIPFASTFAVFATKRACDQVSISVAYPRLNVKINGSYGGIPTGKAGATHQSVQDIAIMRSMPNMTVIVPADAMETEKVVFAAAEVEGPVYIRTVRCPVPVIFEENYQFRIGKAVTLREGNDITLISTGMMTSKVISASEILSKEGIKARVIHMPTIKPIDKEAIFESTSQTRAIITVENHSIIGGLGGAVAEVLTESHPTILKRIGIRDHFGESGDNEAIFSKYGMNTENIVKEVKETIKG